MLYITFCIWNHGTVFSLTVQVSITFVGAGCLPLFLISFFFSSQRIKVFVLFPDGEWRRGASL